MISERIKGWASTSSKLVAASAQLAKTQAELATLNNVTLPRLYHAVGKRIIASQGLPPDLVPHREKVHELEAAIATKSEEPQAEPATGFAAKAKHLAQQAASRTAKATADATARVQIQAAYVSLGKQFVEKYSSALPEDLGNTLAAARKEKQDLVARIATLNAAHSGRTVTPKRLCVAGICAGLLVVGVLIAPKWRQRSASMPPPVTQAAKPSKQPTEAKKRQQTPNPDRPDTKSGSPTEPPRFTGQQAEEFVRSHLPSSNLYVEGVKALSVEAARVFAACPSNLAFPDLEVLDEDVALALLNNRGATVSNSGLRMNTSIMFGKLRNLPPRVAIYLSRGRWKLIMLHFRSAGEPVKISDEAAMGLAMYRGSLMIMGGDMDMFGQNSLGNGAAEVAWAGPSSLQSAALVKKLCDSHRSANASASLFLDCKEMTILAAEALASSAVGLDVSMPNLESMGDNVAEPLLRAHANGVRLSVGGPFKSHALGAVRELVTKCGD